MITVEWPSFRCAKCDWKPPVGATADDCQKHVIDHYIEEMKERLIASLVEPTERRE